MTTKSLLGFALLSTIYGRSQTISHHVLGSDGGHSSGSGGSIAWTIGEPVSGTFSSAANITTVGFLQTEQVEIVTLIKEQGSETNVLVYPNPVRDELRINFAGLQAGVYALEITDAIGKLVYKANEEVSADQTSASLKVNEYAAGNYFLNIKRADFNKSIKITKSN